MAELTHAFIVSAMEEPRVRTVGEFVYRSTSLAPTHLFGSLEFEELIDSYAKPEDPGCVAVVLLTGDDLGRPGGELARRPCQDVVLVLGYFLARLPDGYVIVLRDDELDGPSDVAGALYLSFDDAGWRHALADALKNLGVNIDFDQPGSAGPSPN